MLVGTGECIPHTWSPAGDSSPWDTSSCPCRLHSPEIKPPGHRHDSQGLQCRADSCREIRVRTYRFLCLLPSSAPSAPLLSLSTVGDLWGERAKQGTKPLSPASIWDHPGASAGLCQAEKAAPSLVWVIEMPLLPRRANSMVTNSAGEL